jgi:CMP-N-acetylneuraminic acid synthetase
MEAIRSAVEYLEDNNMSANVYVSLQANSPEITADVLDNAINCFIENERNEIISVDKNLMQNAAFRILRRGYTHQRDLSTKCGVFVCDVLDVHTIEDVKLIEERTKH